MTAWTPTEMWKEEDAYVIGGGPSLRSFPWGLLRGRNTVGCNSAFILGADVCGVLVFGDIKWWNLIGRDRLREYGGVAVACVDGDVLDRNDERPPWVLLARRYPYGDGVSTVPGQLAWNGNTGSLAINLALQFGARRVFLLGFDMRAEDFAKKPNWHDVRCEIGSNKYPFFARELAVLARALPAKYPGRQVWNVTDDSALECFPKVSVGQHFGAALKGAIK